jgi:hypothetical protein
VAHGFDVVAVGVEHEGAVVMRVVVRPQPGRTVVGTAGGQRCGMEGIDRGAVGRRPAQVAAAGDGWATLAGSAWPRPTISVSSKRSSKQGA